MSQSLPPLTALRAFEAAARHMSFQNAAAELHVTPAALSFQIKSLEAHLGQKLFRRHNRAVELTEAGRALAPGASEGFDALARAWRAARRIGETHILRVTAGPAFTAKWLAPRMYSFAQAHPDIELRIIAGLQLMDFGRDEVDVAIRFGYGPYEGLFSQVLAHEWLIPAMHPNLVAAYPEPADLLRAPLIHARSDDFLDPPCDWPAWFRAVGVPGNPVISAEFTQHDHALSAALAGAGVVLARQSFAADDLRSGRLVAPFRTAISTRAHFSFLCAIGAETRPQICAFRDWIFSEMDKSACMPEELSIIPVEELQD